MNQSKNSLTREIKWLKNHLTDLEECYYKKRWNIYLGDPIYPQIVATRKDLRESTKLREALEPQYYFKFCVSYHQKILYNTYKMAVRKAKILNEEVFLQIYSKKNIYDEVYDEFTLNFEQTDESLEILKSALIKSFIELTATPEQITKGN